MWRVQTDEPCGGVISGWDGRTLRRVSGGTRDGGCRCERVAVRAGASGRPAPHINHRTGGGAARSAAPRAKILGAAFIFRLTLKRKTVIINSR